MRCRLTLSLLAFLTVAACAGRQETTAPQVLQPAAPPPAAVVAPQPVVAPPRVGLLVPLTGSAASLGQDLLDAAQLALFDIGRSDLELVPRDTGDRPQQAEAAARAALDAGAELLVGPLFGRSTTAVAPIAAERGVSVLSFSNDASIARPGVYVLGFRPEEQIERVVAFAAGQGLTRFAALAPDDIYGSRAIAAWRAAVARQAGANATIAETYPADSDSPSAAVRQVAGFGRPDGLPDAAGEPGMPTEAPAAEVALPPPGFDALMIADGGPRVSSVAALLAYYDIAPPATRLLGTMRWQEDPAVMSDAGLRGSWLATWPPDAAASFAQRFSAVYGREPAPLAVLAYDATALAAFLAQGQPRFTPEQLTDPQGFVGGLGVFRLRPDGLAEHGLAIVETDAAGGRVVDPAPQSFAGGFAQR